MRHVAILACILCVTVSTGVPASYAMAAPVAQATTAPEPVTLDGIIDADSDDTLAFTPDGSTVFFDRSDGPHKSIMLSTRTNGHWSPPRVASFSGRWFDQNPVLAPDGSYLLFDSDRPTSIGAKPLRQSYFPSGPGPGANLWRVARDGHGWGTPVWLGAVVNDDVFIDFASIAADNTVYYLHLDKATKVTQMWSAAYRNGAYQAPQRVMLGDPSVSLHDPAIAPDQSFIVFDYGKVKGGLGRLCIAFREGDHWGQPIDLGDAVNTDLPWGPHLAPDGRTVYLTGHSGIARLPLGPWLDNRSPAHR